MPERECFTGSKEQSLLFKVKAKEKRERNTLINQAPKELKKKSDEKKLICLMILFSYNSSFGA